VAADGPWTVVVNYGDGTGDMVMVVTTPSFTLSHTYARAGLYEVTYLVRDRFGAESTDSFLVAINAPLPQAQPQRFTVNDGGAQRSMVNSLTVTYDSVMTVLDGAYTVRTASGAVVGTRVINQVIDGKTVSVIQFTSNTAGGSLTDGNYTLEIDGSKVTDASGAMYNGGATETFSFYRFFGDSNGDRKVDDADLAAFRAAARSQRGETRYRNYFDSDSDCDVDATDYNQFLARYRRTLA
jgi:hypothetical protein